MQVCPASDRTAWDSFLTRQRFSPFLQSWAMGEVYRAIGQEPVRLEVREGEQIVGVCFGHVVPARRGKHLSVPYGPLVPREALAPLMDALKAEAAHHGCAFIRLSPFWPINDQPAAIAGSKLSPLHLLAEHLWYLPLRTVDPWASDGVKGAGEMRSEDEIFKNMRATQRNLIRRAEKEGVTIRASTDPERDLGHFLALHDETRKRHGFTPYSNAFFRAQVAEFAKTGNVTLYLAEYQNEVIASSIHMHFGGETSYHHGASTHRFSKIPSSYLLQWTAIRDALKRGDSIYNFWGIAPTGDDGKALSAKHPFAGVTLFKTGFGGTLLELTHCCDLPLTGQYYVTRWFEFARKWKRGF